MPENLQEMILALLKLPNLPWFCVSGIFPFSRLLSMRDSGLCGIKYITGVRRFASLNSGRMRFFTDKWPNVLIETGGGAHGLPRRPSGS